MKIDRIILYLLNQELKNPFETSFGSIKSRQCILIEAYADGVRGYGECVADREPGYSYETTGTAWHILRDFLVPQILGKDINNPYELSDLIDHIRGHPMAKAGLEMCLWDLMGKDKNKSLKQLLGGSTDCVDVGVSIGIQDTKEELLKAVEDYLDEGYKRVKVKIKPGRDVADVEYIRKAYPDLKLQVDANAAYTIKTIDSITSLDKLNLLMIEQPLAEDDLLDHSRIRSKFTTPICLDESISSLRHARQALELKACGIVNIKAGRVGGLSWAKAIHDLCYQQDIAVWCGGMLETGVGRAANLALASLPGFTYPGDISASDRYYSKDVTCQKFILKNNSTIDVPDGPGLGIDLDQKVLEKATMKKLSIGL